MLDGHAPREHGWRRPRRCTRCAGNVLPSCEEKRRVGRGEDAHGIEERRAAAPDDPRGEMDVEAGHISLGSPLGRALRGRKVGEEIALRLPRGARNLRVVEIRNGEDQ